jgi:branched-chain amino acid transport system ATP-binding protein
VLSINRLVAGYGLVPVIRGLDLALGRGEVLAVLGRNGAGKSTLGKAVLGLLPHSSGSIKLEQRELLGLPPHKIARSGVGYVPQGRAIFPRLTVEENLLAGTRMCQDRRIGIDERVFGYFPVLRERLRQHAGTMSGGEQEMLAIARALCGRPRLIVMDEPSDGVAPKIVDMLAELLPAMARDLGVAMLLIEQNVDLARAVARRCAVMDRGEIVRMGNPDELTAEALKKHLAI